MARPAFAELIRPEDAAEHLGEEVTVEGRVANVVCSPLACLLSFSTDFSGLVASISGEDVGRFPSPKETYTDRQVRVAGTIVERNGRMRLELSDPAQIAVVGAGGAGDSGGPIAARAAPSLDPPAAPAADAAAPASGQSRSRVVSRGQFVSRPGPPRGASAARSSEGPAASVGATSDPVEFELRALRQQITRLEDTTKQLSETVAALQERLTVLEQGGGTAGSGVDPSLLPELPPYVVAGDTANRAQHVKRGWSSERLLRAIGPPVNTVTEPNGYMTWYYSYGRAVTLDARGRVTSSVGF